MVVGEESNQRAHLFLLLHNSMHDANQCNSIRFNELLKFDSQKLENRWKVVGKGNNL